MFYKQFLKISDALNEDFVKEFDFWLATLPLNKQENITTSLVSSKFDVPYEIVNVLLQYANEEGILAKKYMIQCPVCEMPYKKIEINEIPDYISTSFYCHDCENENDIILDNIFVVYDRTIKPDISEDELNNEILKRLGLKSERVDAYENFNKADSLTYNMDDVYKSYYNPDESAYMELSLLKEKLDWTYRTKKEKGDAYENLVLKLFDLARNVTPTKKIHTDINQFDCTIFVHSSLEIPTVFDNLKPYFISECKNEKSIPKNTYVHKLSGIMDTNDASVGIIFSRKKAGNPAIKLSRTLYLTHLNSSKKKYIINLYNEDLENLITRRENLLKYINMKLMELSINSEIDLN